MYFKCDQKCWWKHFCDEIAWTCLRENSSICAAFGVRKFKRKRTCVSYLFILPHAVSSPLFTFLFRECFKPLYFSHKSLLRNCPNFPLSEKIMVSPPSLGDTFVSAGIYWWLFKSMFFQVLSMTKVCLWKPEHLGYSVRGHLSRSVALAGFLECHPGLKKGHGCQVVAQV